MSEARFQALLTRLVIDPDFRDAVAAQGEDALPADLTARERRRLAMVAIDPGLTVTRTLHKGFRLGKLVSLLPLTIRALGDERLADQIDAFWRQRPSSGFHYLEEALAFCAFLPNRLTTEPDASALADIVAFERASLILRQARPAGEAPPPQTIDLHHWLNDLLPALQAGDDLQLLPAFPHRLVGWIDPEATVQWAVAGASTPGNLPLLTLPAAEQAVFGSH